MKQLILIAHNLRSAHNIGSLLRTAEGLAVGKIWLTGYSPYPLRENDDRLPHEARKTDQQIAKTALGAEKLLEWHHEAAIESVLDDLKQQGFVIAALEQAPGSTKLVDFQAPDKLALIVGREVEGLEPEILAECDVVVEIPMLGQKESFNVVQAAAMALYHCRYQS
ncbi:TrmH family RNA methyltransferase [Candidatus Saccharibacteria bacterium CG_4_10_14_0_2_um_filter_52_9]|nr:MAG: TrmH family RNA methyltransferase [Candidatus Saccharibacteria bacterium CG_4_10_14_0_2_um_filter_52_9]